MPFTTINNWISLLPVIKEMNASGISQTTIAKQFGVSRQRVKQIYKKYGIPFLAAKIRKDTKLAAYKLKWGDKNASDVYQQQRVKYRAKKSQAKKNGVEFSIEFGELNWPTHCPILGIELNYFAETREETSVSFDRISPKLGYVKGNVLVCSWRANRIKNDGTAEEHRKIAAYLDTTV
jgi:DNA-binding XRE family transcriptional regulator